MTKEMNRTRSTRAKTSGLSELALLLHATNQLNYASDDFSSDKDFSHI